MRHTSTRSETGNLISGGDGQEMIFKSNDVEINDILHFLGHSSKTISNFESSSSSVKKKSAVSHRMYQPPIFASATTTA